MNNAPTNILDELRLLEAPRPLTWVEWLILFLAVAVVVGFIFWRRAQARRRLAPSPNVSREAEEDALAELQKLRAMISVANSRPYAIRVSGVVRRYLERRFGLRAPKRSTEEFLAEARGSAKLDERHRRHLAEFLAACDFLKFARAIAEVPELEHIHETAVRFVGDTQRPIPPLPQGEGRGEGEQRAVSPVGHAGPIAPKPVQLSSSASSASSSAINHQPTTAA